MKVIIDRIEGEYYIGQYRVCSPEVDPEVLIRREGGNLMIGNFYQVQVIDREFDLFGEII